MAKLKCEKTGLEEAIVVIKNANITVLLNKLITVQLELSHLELITEEKQDLVEEWSQSMSNLIEWAKNMNTLKEHYAKRN